jgi:NADPH:quinone reductase-like Zn-dependent oxidoreductase
MGAHQVVHPRTLLDEVAASTVDAVFTPFSDGNVEAFATVLKPRGAVVAIDEPDRLDLLPLKDKSQSWHWEYMFTRPLYEPGSRRQQQILTELAGLIDAGTIRSTVTTRLRPINAATLTEAHRLVEGGRTIGKVVVEA